MKDKIDPDNISIDKQLIVNNINYRAAKKMKDKKLSLSKIKRRIKNKA